MAHTPLKMTVKEAHEEIRYGWEHAYSPEAIAQAVGSLRHKAVGYRINILVARLCFRGIYFPQMGPLAWMQLIAENKGSIFQVIRDGFGDWLNSFKKNHDIPTIADQAALERLGYIPARKPPTAAAASNAAPR
jgi:hypothetical protein